MLQEQTVPGATFELLKILMKDEKLNEFYLAGGTAIALYLGHRTSIDLDLFSLEDFDNTELEFYLSQQYNFLTDNKARNTLKGSIKGVKIDFITFNTPLCEQIQNIGGIRLFSLQDIIAMKLLAIADNGTRLKDFIDIAYLSMRFSFDEMLSFVAYKFPNKNLQIYRKALLFHNDIYFDVPIQLTEKKYQWGKIAKRLDEMVTSPKKVFEHSPL